jgi:phage terminase large subunit GpA-like protein
MFEGDGGNTFRVVSCCVDTGYMTDHVYKYIKPRQGRRILAVKGSSDPGKPVFRRPKSPNNQGVIVYNLGTDTIKDTLFSKMKIGQVHFPDTLDEIYFEQLTAEKVQTKMRYGFAQRVYIKDPGARNESLDCLVYAYASCVILNPAWDRILPAAEEPEKEEDKPEEPQPTPVRQIIPRNNRKRGWMSNY